jgi:hypothetical protein
MAISSLFGPTPAELIFAQQKEARQEQLLRNQQIAQQGAEFGPFRGLYQAGLRMGEVGGQAIAQSLFPAPVDPRLQEASAVQAVLSKFSDMDQSDPKILERIGRELMPVAPNAGLRALTLAKELSVKEKPIPIRPGGALVSPTGQLIYERPSEDKGVKVGVTENTGEIIYSDGSQQYVIQNNIRVPFTGKVAEQGGQKINLGLGEALNQMFAKTEGQEKAQAWALAGKVYKDNASILSTIDEFKTTAPKAFLGTGAGAQKEISKAFGALGIPISERASNTELLEAFSSNFVQKIAKNFPGSQAIKELEQLVKSQPNFKQELPTITRLLDRFRDERLADQLTYQQMSKMPQAQRYATDSNIISVDNYNKILKYRRYEQMFNSKAQMTKAQVTEAKQLQAELGLD